MVSPPVLPPCLSVDGLAALTAACGEAWALPHVRRVRHLTGIISAGLAYDSQALAIAVYLHDWGTFACYRQPGQEHAHRSREIAAGEILPRMSLPDDAETVILEAIARHDYRDSHPVVSTEALLLREADFLDLIGIVGFAWGFAWGPNDLRVGYERILKRRDAIQGHFTLPAARELAAQRLERMAQCLHWLEQESYGYL